MVLPSLRIRVLVVWFGAVTFQSILSDSPENWSIFRSTQRLWRSPMVNGDRKLKNHELPGEVGLLEFKVGRIKGTSHLSLLIFYHILSGPAPFYSVPIEASTPFCRQEFSHYFQRRIATAYHLWWQFSPITYRPVFRETGESPFSSVCNQLSVCREDSTRQQTKSHCSRS